MIRTNKGFTMIELMVVIVIMGVLAVLAIPKLTDVITKAKFGEIPVVMGTWEHAMLTYHSETGTLATAITQLPIEQTTTSKWFSYAQATYVYSAVVTSGKTVGPYAGGGSESAASTATEDATTHAVTFPHTNGFATKYMPNF